MLARSPAISDPIRNDWSIREGNLVFSSQGTAFISHRTPKLVLFSGEQRKTFYTLAGKGLEPIFLVRNPGHPLPSASILFRHPV